VSRVGLLKALGWTSRDIVGLQITKAAIVGLPAIAGGLMLAYALVYAPSQQWVGTLLLGWQETAPIMHLDAGHAAPVFLEVAGILLIPYLAAVLWSSLVQAASNPQDLLNRGN
jgi:ABC-type antimicrobial peptide transport system permease subunit